MLGRRAATRVQGLARVTNTRLHEHALEEEQGSAPWHACSVRILAEATRETESRVRDAKDRQLTAPRANAAPNLSNQLPISVMVHDHLDVNKRISAISTVLKSVDCTAARSGVYDRFDERGDISLLCAILGNQHH